MTLTIKNCDKSPKRVRLIAPHDKSFTLIKPNEGDGMNGGVGGGIEQGVLTYGLERKVKVRFTSHDTINKQFASSLIIRVEHDGMWTHMHPHMRPPIHMHLVRMHSHIPTRTHPHTHPHARPTQLHVLTHIHTPYPHSYQHTGEVVIPLRAHGWRPMLVHDELLDIGYVVLNQAVSRPFILHNKGALPARFRCVS